MSSVNNVTLLGWTSQDPIIKATNSGLAIAKIILAVEDMHTSKQGEKIKRIEYFGITYFGKIAEIIQKYVKKGNQLYCEGYLKHEEWEHERKHHRKLEIYGSKILFLTKTDTNINDNDYGIEKDY